MKGRKAVSPIVATLLLILIAVAAAVVLYAWVSDLSSSTKSTGAENSGIAFTIEAATIKSENTTHWNITTYVRNIGSVPIEKGNWSVYVLNPTDNTIAAQGTLDVDSTINPGDLEPLKFLLSKSSSTINSGDYYIVKVVSPQGVSDSAYVKAES